MPRGMLTVEVTLLGNSELTNARFPVRAFTSMSARSAEGTVALAKKPSVSSFAMPGMARYILLMCNR